MKLMNAYKVDYANNTITISSLEPVLTLLNPLGGCSLTTHLDFYVEPNGGVFQFGILNPNGQLSVIVFQLDSKHLMVMLSCPNTDIKCARYNLQSNYPVNSIGFAPPMESARRYLEAVLREDAILFGTDYRYFNVGVLFKRHLIAARLENLIPIDHEWAARVHEVMSEYGLSYYLLFDDNHPLECCLRALNSVFIQNNVATPNCYDMIDKRYTINVGRYKDFISVVAGDFGTVKAGVISVINYVLGLHGDNRICFCQHKGISMFTTLDKYNKMVAS